MKKSILYLSTLVAMSLGMTSCIDNDEPASLKTLREAYANELTADAAKINALAAQEQAKVAGEVAKAAQKELDVKIKEVEVAKAELALEVAKADNEVKIADATKRLEQAQADLEKAKVTNQAALVDAERTLVNAEKALAAAKEQAMEDQMTAELKYVKFADTKVSNALQAVVEAENAYVEEVADLVYAQREYAYAVYVANADTASSIVALDKSISEKEYAVVSAEYAVSAAERALAEWKDSKGYNAETWGKVYVAKSDEIDGLQKQIDQLVMQRSAAEVELSKANAAYAEATTETEAKLKEARDAASKKVSDLNEKINELYTLKGYASTLKSAAYDLAKGNDSYWDSNDLAEYESFINTQVTALEATVATKKSDLAKAKAGLENAKADKAAYLAGVYTASNNIETKANDVVEAEKAVAAAKTKLDIATAYYNSVVALFDETEEE